LDNDVLWRGPALQEKLSLAWKAGIKIETHLGGAAAAASHSLGLATN
jgi:hypothetical protein